MFGEIPHIDIMGKVKFHIFEYSCDLGNKANVIKISIALKLVRKT